MLFKIAINVGIAFGRRSGRERQQRKWSAIFTIICTSIFVEVGHHLGGRVATKYVDRS